MDLITEEKLEAARIAADSAWEEFNAYDMARRDAKYNQLLNAWIALHKKFEAMEKVVQAQKVLEQVSQ